MEPGKGGYSENKGLAPRWSMKSSFYERKGLAPRWSKVLVGEQIISFKNSGLSCHI